MVKVTSERKGPWLNILFNNTVHLAVDRDKLLKVQSWANHNPKWMFWKEKSRYYIETVHINGVKDLSDYSDRFLWVQVLREFEHHCNCEVQYQPTIDL